MGKKIYICHPLRGDVEGNIEKVNKIAREIALQGDIPLVPHHIALYLNDNEPGERELGLGVGIILLRNADEMQVHGYEIFNNNTDFN